MEASSMRNVKIDGFAALRAGEALRPHQYSLGALRPTEVDIAITHCGICHSDLHLIDNDWGVSTYPLVPGHEIIGTVTRAGSEAAEMGAGRRVGVGWLAGSCMSCDQCRDGNENLCFQTRPACVGREGGYASHVRVDVRFAAVIPDGLSSESAAPLLCAGITVFAPLSRRCLKRNSRVGVVGLGGLGHLAVQYAHAMGCAVTVFSTSAGKEEEARRFGADRFVDTSRPGSLAQAKNTCDFVLATVPVNLPWAEYLNVLRPNGALCIVGASPGEVRIPVVALLDGQKSIGGSAVGSNAEIREMFRFSAKHAIMPMTELYPMKQVNHVLNRLRQNRVRYRAVLVNQS
ncbi:MAG: NAD(P)-dependent alcohol dehydrogenase [Candidatus Binatia bacterium]